MTRKKIQSEILKIFNEEFEIKNPGLDDDLTQEHGFDSIDAIELLVEIEETAGHEADSETKKQVSRISEPSARFTLCRTGERIRRLSSHVPFTQITENTWKEEL